MQNKPFHSKKKIAVNPSTSPSLVIKTNLDPEDATVENPYLTENTNDKEKTLHFFDE
ncbi:hypothetical protein WAK64_04825 [Bacillus spongiae]|uniref:Uncharacterized protein n=1 Tax=Bacillus spongiae TaxID=2683610 RepID=A0ABU8HAW8_9BACI